MPMLDSYLFFDGTCKEAMNFYQKAIGGEIQAMLTYAESPDPSQCGGVQANDRIMHAHLLLEGRNLMASDTPPGQPGPAPAGFALSLNYPSADDARKVFDKLANGGKVMMPISKTFWSESFGMVTDKFGVPWMVSGGEALK